eukprot:109221_1
MITIGDQSHVSNITNILNSNADIDPLVNKRLKQRQRALTMLSELELSASIRTELKRISPQSKTEEFMCLLHDIDIKADQLQVLKDIWYDGSQSQEESKKETNKNKKKKRTRKRSRSCGANSIQTKKRKLMAQKSNVNRNNLPQLRAQDAGVESNTEQQSSMTDQCKADRQSQIDRKRIGNQSNTNRCNTNVKSVHPIPPLNQVNNHGLPHLPPVARKTKPKQVVLMPLIDSNDLENENEREPKFDVSAWLRNQGMEEYITAFRDNGFDTLSTVVLLNQSYLQKIGVAKFGHQLKIMMNIEKLYY